MRLYPSLRANWRVAMLRVVILLTVVYGVMPSAFAALNIDKVGDLSATDFDELGLDPTGLVGYRQLNGNAHDASGLHNDGTINGATPTTDRFGVANGAMDFNGGSWINAGNATALNPLAQISLAVWVQWSSFYSNNSGHALVSHSRFANNGYMLYQATGSPWNRVQAFIVTPGGRATVVSQTTFSIGVWYHLVFTYDHAMFRLYVNGIQDPNTATSTGDIIPSDYDLLFGSTYTSGNSPLNASLDEIKIFSRALSDAEILTMYNHEKGKFSVGKDGTMKASQFVEDPALPVQMRSKKQSLTVKGHLIQN